MGSEHRIVVMASGRGSNLQSLIDAREQGKLDSNIVRVISDQPGSKALVRAARKGIETEVVALDAALSGPAPV